MSYKLLIILMAIAAVGCSKEDTSLDQSLPYEPSENPIGFSSVDWRSVTKGHICDNNTNPLDTMEVNAYYTKQSKWKDATNIAQFMTHQFISKVGNDWVYSPIKYWSNIENDKISFFANSPYGEINCVDDETTGKPTFKYEASPFAIYNDDLLMGTVLNATRSDAGVNFKMKHMLTRINVEVAAINAPTLDSNGQTLDNNGNGTGEYNVEYTVNGISFNDILTEGEVKVDDDSGKFSWEVDPTSSLYATASQGQSLMSHDDPKSFLTTTSIEDSDAKKYIYNDVFNEGMAFFVMPQQIENNEYGTTPTVQIRIRKSYVYYSSAYDPDTVIGEPNANGKYPYQGEMIYVPDAVALPTPGNNGWGMGDHLTMRFVFDLKADNPMPLTVLSMIYNYDDVDIDMNLNTNVYLYADKYGTINLNSDETEVKMNIYTNYPYTLTKPHEYEDMYGEIKESQGLVFYSDSKGIENHNYWTPKTTGEVDGDGYTKYKVTSRDNSDYFFYYWLKQSTRQDEGCYVGSDTIDINPDGSDAVYLLRLVVNDEHLIHCDEDGTPNTNGAYGEFSGDIGVEILSNAGGLVTKLFPITVIKKLE